MFSECLLYTTEQEIVIFSHEQLEKLINRESKATLILGGSRSKKRRAPLWTPKILKQKGNSQSMFYFHTILYGRLERGSKPRENYLILTEKPN